MTHASDLLQSGVCAVHTRIQCAQERFGQHDKFHSLVDQPFEQVMSLVFNYPPVFEVNVN